MNFLMIFELVKLAPRGTAVLGPSWLLASLSVLVGFFSPSLLCRSLWLGKKGGGTWGFEMVS